VNIVDVFCILVENRTVKPVEIILRSGEGGMRENNVGGKSNQGLL
jgi:hypothetical protein